MRGSKKERGQGWWDNGERYDWPSAVEMHFMFYNKKIPMNLLEQLNRKHKERYGRKNATSMELWQVATRDVLTPDTPFEVHEALYELCYVDWEEKKLGPRPVWIPEAKDARNARAIRVGQRLRESGVPSPEVDADHATVRDLAAAYVRLQEYSVKNQEDFWSCAMEEMGVRFRQKPNRMFYPRAGSHAGQEQWFPGAAMNAADSCFLNSSVGSMEEQPALIWAKEGAGDTIANDGELHQWTYAQLLDRSSRIANCLRRVGVGKGNRVGICMPMTAESVAIYLAVVMTGGAVVGIADSFSRHEICTRLRVSKADAVITQDTLFRNNKYIPLYDRVAGAGDDCQKETGKSVQVICLPADLPSGSDGASGFPLRCTLRPVDLSYMKFLSLSSSSDFETVACHPQDVTNVLFSSGTTGEPKAIPWDHVAPLKAASDAMLHHDVKQGDVVCWPTNLGWMMGPWLLYAGLVNGAAVAIFEGSPLGKAFCQFVEAAGVTMLGTVPSIVKAWKAKNSITGSDWSSVLRFSSSGEASNPKDYHWLSSRVPGYAPVIEYIGGTELAGGYMSGSLVQPQAPSHFSTFSFGTDLRLLDSSMAEIEADAMEEAIFKQGVCEGEVAIVPPMLGSSYKLLNRDHDKVYFSDMPCTKEGTRMRKHGDMLAFRPGGLIQAKGRTDDTMNLGGIKTSSLEIENVCNGAVGALGLPVKEVAAVAIPPSGGGPDLLWICAAVKGKMEEAKSSGFDAAWAKHFQKAISKNLNPLFKVHKVLLVQELPRTASNKIMRKALQAQCLAQSNTAKSKL